MSSSQARYKIGDKAEMTKIFSDADIIKYAQASGDSNPIHCDGDYAVITGFKGGIVHGILVAGLISAVLGTKLPGMGTIYVSQNLKFIKPVFINDSVTARVEITNIDENKKRLTLSTYCFTGDGNLVITGEAVVIPPNKLL